MSIFQMHKWLKTKKKYDEGKIDIQTFVDFMKNVTLYYSTPLGEDLDGNPQLYILCSHQSDDQYYPAFRTKEGCLRFFNGLGRNGFIIIEGDLKSVLSSLDSSPVLADLGVIIEPNSAKEVMVPPHIRVTE